MKEEVISTLLFGVSFFCFFISLILIYNMTLPKTYGVYYEFSGNKGYAEVSGNPAEIIDELKSRQMIHSIIPIR